MVRITGFGEITVRLLPRATSAAQGASITPLVVGTDDRKVSRACTAAVKGVLAEEREMILDEFVGPSDG